MGPTSRLSARGLTVIGPLLALLQALIGGGRSSLPAVWGDNMGVGGVEQQITLTSALV